MNVRLDRNGRAGIGNREIDLGPSFGGAIVTVDFTPSYYWNPEATYSAWTWFGDPDVTDEEESDDPTEHDDDPGAPDAL